MTVVQPVKAHAVAPLAFIKDTNDALAQPKAEACTSATGITLTHTTLPNEQVFVCRTAKGVLQGFYPTDSLAANTASPPAEFPNRATRPVKAGVYTVPGNETLKDLKLTVRTPFYWALLLILAGVVVTTLVGLLLTRWSAVHQLNAHLKLQGLNPRAVPSLTEGRYRLRTTKKELSAYLTWYKFWLPTEHAEHLAQALLSWRALSKELDKLEGHMRAIKSRGKEFEVKRGQPYFVISMLQRVLDGGANLDKRSSLPTQSQTRAIEILAAIDVQQTIREAARLAERLLTYQLAREIGKSQEAVAARAALLRKLDDQADWQGLTAAEFQKYDASLTALRSTLLGALDLEQAGAANPPLVQMLRTKVKSLRPFPLSLKGPWPAPAPLRPLLTDAARPRRRTTLSVVAPPLLWNWLAVLAGAFVAWLLGSVTGLQTLYFTGEPWGSTPMDYARAFAYGGVTLAAVVSVASFAKTLLPAATLNPPAVTVTPNEGQVKV
ncbi:hypothetical protein [Deinococcus aestuarii]|uniref:hypothetical protein n=1 Tax=Deinococcus aestuarii TaxID=2774531 RepID=UPI001C0CBF8B|nr:hypothetical protein [Deinococcus aestuarii]